MAQPCQSAHADTYSKNALYSQRVAGLLTMGNWAFANMGSAQLLTQGDVADMVVNARWLRDHGEGKFDDVGLIGILKVRGDCGLLFCR